MARVALPPRWAGALTQQRGPLRMYQWLWLVLCVVGSLLASAPRVLSQPVMFRSDAVVQIDAAQRYRQVYATNDAGAMPNFIDIQNIAFQLLKLDYPTLGSDSLGVSYTPQPDGHIVVTAVSRNAVEAQQLANAAAETLARSIRAAGGRETFRRLSGWERYAAYQVAPARTPFQQELRDIELYSAFPLNRPVDIVSQPFTVDQLAPEDLSDLARAFEVRDVELSRVDLPALRAERERQQPGVPALTREACTAVLEAVPGSVAQIDSDVCRLERGSEVLRAALTYLQTTLGATFAPTTPSAAFQSAVAEVPSAPVDRRIPFWLALAVVVGLLFGGVGVAVDRSAGVMPKLRELWSYRELVRNLVLRDLRVRYKGSALGYLWTQLAPLMLMLVFLFVFSTLQKQQTALFPVFLIVGLLPWNFCAEAVTGGSRSILDNANLIKKVFFPREILPMVSVFSALVNYLLSLPMMLLVMAVAQVLYPSLGRLNFSWTFAYLPVLVIIQALFLTGLVFFTSALAVSFRDFVHLIGILVQFWFFLTPVVYSLSALNLSPVQEQAMRWLNPMASLIEFYHEILYGRQVAVPNIPTPGLPALESVLRILVTSVVVLALGYWFFQRRSGDFGEQI